jgi:poly [ADP-ribose] polymerase
MANVIEEAKSGRASCRTCKKPIAKGELRLGIETQTQFSDAPSLAWHHVLCAASKLPIELKAALDDYPGEVPNRAELEAAIAEAGKKASAKPAGFPYVDRAPTGRARCMQCGQPIDKASFRVAAERELEVGANITRGAGYLHPGCVAAHLEATGAIGATGPTNLEALFEELRKNSRLAEGELDGVIADIEQGPDSN